MLHIFKMKTEKFSSNLFIISHLNYFFKSVITIPLAAGFCIPLFQHDRGFINSEYIGLFKKKINLNSIDGIKVNLTVEKPRIRNVRFGLDDKISPLRNNDCVFYTRMR